MSAPLRTTTLPHWAFHAIGRSDINVLIDRCEFETIIVTRQGRPDLVLINPAEWQMLTVKRETIDPSREAKATPSDGVKDVNED
jgi:PHD/YefM family antitoxin component YafN of YafNO toxin-antitoxin module